MTTTLTTTQYIVFCKYLLFKEFIYRVMDWEYGVFLYFWPTLNWCANFQSYKKYPPVY